MSLAYGIVLDKVEFIVQYNLERLGFLDEFLSFGCKFQQSVVLNVFPHVAGNDCLAYHRVPYLRIFIFSCTETFQFVMFVRHDVVGGTSFHKVYYIVLHEILFHRSHGGKYYLKSVLSLYLDLRMQTVVATATVLTFILLTEIVQQHLPTTHRGLRVCGCLLQQLSADVLLGHGLVLHELLEFLQVFVAVKDDTKPLSAITSGTSGLLIISFEALRYVVVYNETHVGFVNSHTECNRCHDDMNVLHEEIVLCLRARGTVETGMIRCRLNIVGAEYRGQLFHFLP